MWFHALLKLPTVSGGAKEPRIVYLNAAMGDNEPGIPMEDTLGLANELATWQ